VRLSSLVRLRDACLRGRLGAQLGKVLSLLITLTHLVALPFAARASSGDASHVVVVSALGWLTWLAGSCIALSAVGSGAEDAAIRELALGRGYSRRALELAEVLASFRRVLGVVGAPGVALALVACGFARSWSTFAQRGALVLGVLAFAVAVSALTAALVALSRVLAARRPRVFLVAIVLLPHLAHEVFPSVPSVPAVVGVMTRALDALGATVP
jgi:hypothetical protein